MFIISMSSYGVARLLGRKWKRPRLLPDSDAIPVQKEILKIIDRIEMNSPIIFCSGKGIFKAVENQGILNEYNIIFIQRIALLWFNYHLKNAFLRVVEK